MAETDRQPHYRLAVLASHPIQYQAPFYRALAAHPEIDLTVFFCSDWGLHSYHDEGFGQAVKWDIDLLEGYQSEFLANRSLSPNVARFFGLINPAIVRRLRKGDYQAIILHGWAHCTNWLAMFAAFFYQVPVLMRGDSNRAQYQTHISQSLNGNKKANHAFSVRSKTKAKIKQLVLTRLFRRITGFLTIGSQNAEFYAYYGVSPNKMFFVPFAVDNDFFLSQSSGFTNQKANLKRELGIADSTSVILFAGKLVEGKRPMDLLKAYETIAKKHQVALVYVGDGELRQSLEQYARDKGLSQVHFAGFQNQTEIPRYFALADIFVLPSIRESWGLVVNEALCFGLPVVISNQVGAADDLVRDNVNGFIFEAANPAALAEKLDRILADDALRERMGEASKNLIAGWDMQEDVRGILSGLKQILG
jgi:glycosyltransferase involved in cell wall biosynthesis